MTKKIKFEGYELSLYKAEYQNNQALAIMAIMEDGEDYATLTVNLGGTTMPTWQYFNTNMHRGDKMFELLKVEKIITPLGFSAQSGFVSYPMVQWQLEGIQNIEELYGEE
ncbi:hypothetical protein COC69_05665 [Bacillus cereus]|uniref:Uncharacterized protein n=1 Tax=Bacillus cereus TaxID=1396 RepID=A0A9X7CQQ1_BACCE|nr:DUF4313 domain-containing protein [Bacillus cereus]PGS81618.1 hypothetical protein COC69_05665 [Bacillus cereus]